MRAIPAVAALVVLALPASALAGGASQNRSNPYGALFVGQLSGSTQQKQPTPVLPPSLPSPSPNFALPPLQPLPQNAPPPQIVICGMTVAQGDATIDPKMPQHPPVNAPKPSIVIVPAPACQK